MRLRFVLWVWPAGQGEMAELVEDRVGAMWMGCGLDWVGVACNCSLCLPLACTVVS